MKTRFWPRSTDTILFYTKSDEFTFQHQHTGYSEAQLSRYRPDAAGRLYTGRDLTFSTVRRHRQFVWRGVQPPPHRSWGADLEQLEKWWAEGRILTKADGSPRLDGMKIFLDELPGKVVGNCWDDIPRITNTGGERLGYPTQKPLTLLERIIKASSSAGQTVLDPFCGCGTAVHAAEKLGRNWIGIDVTHLAISLVERRLRDAFPNAEFAVHGTPRDLGGARDLAARDKYQFQWWAVSLVDAAPFGGKKKGADGGIDGWRYMATGRNTIARAIVSVKSGDNVSAQMVRDLRGVMEREKAEAGLFITLTPPTKPMIEEASKAGFFDSPFGNKRHPRLQLLTIEALLNGTKPDLPPLALDAAFNRAEREDRTEHSQGSLLGSLDTPPATRAPPAKRGRSSSRAVIDG